MRLPTLLMIYLLLALGWVSVSKLLQDRHQSQDRTLRHAVTKLWGTAHHQNTPKLEKRAITDSQIEVDLELDYRKKGMFWYSTYRVIFDARYQVRAGTDSDVLSFPLPSRDGIYSDFEVLINEKPVEYQLHEGAVSIAISKRSEQMVRVRYHSQGSEQWWYDFATSTLAPSGFNLILRTNFEDIDFPDGSMSPTVKTRTDSGWALNWNYDKVLSGGQIGITMPRKGNPGPLLVDMCMAAPAGLFLFLLVVGTFSLVFEGNLTEIHFAFLGAGYFCFHGLFLYLGDHLPLSIAFTVSAATALFVNVSYARKVSSDEFAFKRLLPALVLYLVLFSSAFLKEGMRGLPLVILAILTLHILMQVTANYEFAPKVASQGSQNLAGCDE